MTVRVLHGLGTMNPGGVETWLMHVLRNIDRDRFQLDICTFGNEAGLYATEVEKLGSRVVRCPKRANLWSFSRRFRQILRDGNYDVMHSHVHLFSGALLRWAKAEGVPTRIAHSHTSQDNRADSPPRVYYRKLMKSWIDRYATHGLAASHIAARQLFGRDWESDDRFRVLYYGIDLVPFRESVSREEVRAELGIPPDAPVLGHVGRFVPPKNHDFLMKIAGEVLQRRPEMHFLLIGDGPLRLEIQAKARAMGFADKIHFVGSRADVPRLMRGGMDVFVFPSLYEGFGLTLLEAQTAGLHCLVSDSVPDETVLSKDLVDFTSLSEGAPTWAAHAIKLFDTPRPSMASMIERISRSQFTIGESLRNLTSVYETRKTSEVSKVAEPHA